MVKPKAIIIIFGTIVFLGITARCNNSGTQSGSGQSSVAERPKCEKALGRIMSDVVLYRDPQCQAEMGTIYGIGELPDGQKGVVIDYVNGSREWKLRSAVTQHSYVMSNDPALRRNLYREIEY